MVWVIHPVEILPKATVSGAVPVVGLTQKTATGGAAVAVCDGVKLGESVMPGIGVGIIVAVDVNVNVAVLVPVAVDMTVLVIVAVDVFVTVAVLVTVADEVLVTVGLTVATEVEFLVDSREGVTDGTTADGVWLKAIGTRVRSDSGRAIC